MFPDSKIAAKFSVAETKCTYITKFGQALYFTRMLVSRVKASGPFVVMFDESLNRSTQTKQMDIHIRFWDSGYVVTWYWDSKFMGHASAETGRAFTVKSKCTSQGTDSAASNGWAFC